MRMAVRMERLRRREDCRSEDYSPASNPLNLFPSIGSQSNYMPSLYILQ